MEDQCQHWQIHAYHHKRHINTNNRKTEISRTLSEQESTVEDTQQSKETTNKHFKVRQMYWLFGRKSQLSLKNKTITYKTILKQMWTKGIELSSCRKLSNKHLTNCLFKNPPHDHKFAMVHIKLYSPYTYLKIPYTADVIAAQDTRYSNKGQYTES